MTAHPDLWSALRTGDWRPDFERMAAAADDPGTVVRQMARAAVAQVEDADLPASCVSARLRREAERVSRWSLARTDPGPTLVGDVPQVSVIVTAHDVAPWIAEALASIEAQTDPGLEVIVVDDHSTDGTSDIVDSFADRDPRFRVVRPALRGGANARNVGVDLARGEFIAFCDGDDVVTDGAYARLLAGVTSDRTDIVFGNFERFSETETSRPMSHIASMSVDLRDVDLADHADLIANRSCWNKLFRATTWRHHDHVFVESARANDIVAVTSAYLAADRISVVTSDVYRYRERPGGTSMTARSGAASSLAAYLEQERQCRELFVEADRPTLTTEHERVSLKASTWGQVRRYLRDDTSAQVDPDVQVALLGLLDAFVDAPDTYAVRRIVFALVAAGSPAATSTSALIGLKAESPEGLVDDLEGWAAAVAAVPTPTRPWQIGRAEAFEAVLATRLDNVVEVAVADASVRDALRRAIDLVVQSEPGLRDHRSIRAARARIDDQGPRSRRGLRSRFGR